MQSRYFLLLLFLINYAGCIKNNEIPEFLNKTSNLFNRKVFKGLNCTQSSSVHRCSIYIDEISEDNYFPVIPEYVVKETVKITLMGSKVKFLPIKVHENIPNLIDYVAEDCKFKVATKEHFKDLTNLKRLSLLDGELTDICSDTFDDLTSLEYLQLKGNRFRYLHPKTFDNLGNLEILLLDDNHIRVLHPTTFHKLENLKQLDLSRNTLYYIDDQLFSKTPKIKELSLFMNNYEGIDPRDFDNLGIFDFFGMTKPKCLSNFLLAGMTKNITELKNYMTKNCKKFDEFQHEVREEIEEYNNWFRNEGVIEKCGKVQAENYDDIPVNDSNSEVNTGLYIAGLITSFVRKIF